MDDELIDILDDARMSYDNLKEVWDKAKVDANSIFMYKDIIRSFKSQLYETMILLRALRDKLGNEYSNNDDEYDLYIRKYGPESDIDNYNTIIESKDNGDMI